MADPEVEQIFYKGLKELEEGNMLAALSNFERAVQLESSPVHCSYFARTIARERGQVKKGMAICREAIEQERNAVHYLNLGKIQLLAGHKIDATETFRNGLQHAQNQQILEELEKLEPRKPPVISFLHRDNPLNKYLGMVLSKLELR